MKILTNLSAACSDGIYVEPPIHCPTVGIQIEGGAHRMLRCSPAGIVIMGGKEDIALPIAELIRLGAIYTDREK